ncbi:hypothetical protein HanPSC8_Chr02g0062611 [Helianthus annuus]|nr:hypothetical protein HanPSC8_Chr02g0062611 [Helianthus annuus]
MVSTSSSVWIGYPNIAQRFYARRRLFVFLALVRNLSKFKVTRVVLWLASSLS